MAAVSLAAKSANRLTWGLCSGELFRRTLAILLCKSYPVRFDTPQLAAIFDAAVRLLVLTLGQVQPW
jgi:hypothetical protein